MSIGFFHVLQSMYIDWKCINSNRSFLSLCFNPYFNDVLPSRHYLHFPCDLFLFQYLHSAGIIHRDLKPGNIGIVQCSPMRVRVSCRGVWLNEILATFFCFFLFLIWNDWSPLTLSFPPLQILDFGMSRTKGEQMTGYVCTRHYRAPEVFLHWMQYCEKGEA